MNKIVAWILDTAKWVAVCAVVVVVIMAMFIFLPPAHAEEGETITFCLDTVKYVTSADVAYVDKNGVEVRNIQFEYAGLKGGWYEDNYQPGKTYVIEMCKNEVIDAYENNLVVPGLLVLFGASVIGATGGCLWAHRSNKKEERRIKK